MESQSEKNESKKTDLLLFPLRKDAWPKWVSDLKDHLWKHCEKSTHTVELDGAKKAKLTPAGMTAQSIFEHQMHAFTELKRHFSECNSAEIESVDITKDNFASELFKVLDEQWKPGDFSSASAKIDELRHAYKTFNGNPIMYFQKIKTLVIWLTKQHHQPNTAEVCKNCVDAVYAFANQKKATNADKMWGVWLATFEREFTHFTLDNLSKDLTKNYDTYLRMKRQEGKVADDEAGDLVTFNARDNERDERDEPERRRPRWNRRHSTGNSRDSRSAHWVDNRERGRSRERGSFRPREGGGSHHSSRGGRNGWKPKRGRSEGDRERLSERKYPHRDSRSPSRHDSRDRRSGEEWMIADSGANRHYHRHNRFLFRREKIDSAIGGMTGDNQASTDEFGIFAARLEDEDGVNIPLTSVGYSVKNAKVGLFSEVQTCFAGNTVIHKGHPERGKHGIILKGSNIFIPYHFDRQTLLWWIKVKPPRTQHCMHAAEMNPNDFVNP